MRLSAPQIPDGPPTGLKPSLRCMKPVTDRLNFDIANSHSHTAAFCVVTLRFTLLGYRRFGELGLLYLEGRKWLGCGYCRVRKQCVQSVYSTKYTPCVTSKEDGVRSNMSRPTDISLQANWFEGCLTVHLLHEIRWNASLMQLGNFIHVFLARRVSGTYAHHQEH